MYLVKTKVGAPELKQWKYPIPGDSDIIRIHRLIINVSDEPKIIKLQMNADARRGTLCDDISCEGGFDDVAWSDDSGQLVFVSTSRDHKKENIRIANTQTGEVTDIFEEVVNTQYESDRAELIGDTIQKPMRLSGTLKEAIGVTCICMMQALE